MQFEGEPKMQAGKLMTDIQSQPRRGRFTPSVAVEVLRSGDGVRLRQDRFSGAGCKAGSAQPGRCPAEAARSDWPPRTESPAPDRTARSKACGSGRADFRLS